MAEGGIEHFQALSEVTVDGKDITAALYPRLLGLTICQKESNHNTLDITIDDTDGLLEMPHYEGSVKVALGWRDGARVEQFDGKISSTEWQYQRRTGRIMISHAMGASNLNTNKQMENRSWGAGDKPEESKGYAKDQKGGAGQSSIASDDGKTVVDVLKKAAPEGMTIKADPKFEEIKRKFWMQGAENFLALGKRLADENGGFFRVDGDTARLVDAAKEDEGDVQAIIGPGGNVLAVRLFPALTRPMWHRAQTSWFDPGKGLFKVLGKATGGSLMEGVGQALQASFQHKFVVGEKGQAERMNTALVNSSERLAKAGWILMDGEPTVRWNSTVTLSGARDGVDGPWKIIGVTHDYHRGAGYTTLLDVQATSGTGAASGTKGSAAP